ncbi:rhomboid domain-containing protein 2 [Brachionichthys hirsutus]|uniref:rhomboid domain-containing protein 2 n=1 Tax=Brachionichthys hirsutus TaxID=412623 RepID=UPI003604D25A
MRLLEYFKMTFELFKHAVPAPTSGVLTLAFLSCLLFLTRTYFHFPPSVLGVGAAVFQNGHFHTLLAFPFFHRTVPQLLLNMAALAFLGGGMEKGVGTVRFLFAFFLLSAITGFLYSVFDLLQGDDGRAQNEGLLPAALACVAVTSTRTRMTKAFLCGVTFPAAALPWLLLIILTALVPHAVLPCNAIAVLVGWVHGTGWLSPLDLSEARAGALEKTTPFRLLRMIGGVGFVPASGEERRRTVLLKIDPPAGSYPVQAYAPSSRGVAAELYEGWPDGTSSLSGPTPPPES